MDMHGFGQHLFMDHQRTLRRAEARDRWSLEEQGARGLLDDAPAQPRRERRWGRIRLRQLCATAIVRLWWGSGEIA